MDNTVRRRGGLRVPNTAFLGWGQVEGCYIEIHWRGYGRCSFCRSVDVAVGHDKRPPHCRPARKGRVGPAEDGPQRPWPYRYCFATRALRQPGIPFVDKPRTDTQGCHVRGLVSDARLLWESSQIQDW